MPSAIDTVLAALELWKEAAGIDPNATSFSGMDAIKARRMFEEIQEAISLDSTGITAALLLSHFVKSRLRAHSVSLMDMLTSPDDVEVRLAKPRALLALLNRPQILQEQESFIAGLVRAMEHYGAAGRDDIRSLLLQHEDVALLRRDALRSIGRLRVDQFLDGQPEPADVPPVYSRNVHQWWNINSLLAAAARMPSGVSLNLIRTPDAFQSYFCFAIRNGGNLFVLSDAPDIEHPLQGKMRRRPDRELDNRAGHNWFPYDLLGIEFDEEVNRLYINASQSAALVAYQSEAVCLKPVAELEAREVLWLSMMFNLIVERFWRQEYRSPALSYTAEMIKVDSALIEAAKAANLPVPAYQPIRLPPLTNKDVLDVATSEGVVGRKYHKPNAWMEERYGHLVLDEALNLIAGPEAEFALEHKSGEVVCRENKSRSALLIERTDATSFGTREQLERDRLYIARFNYATQIRALAEDEFESQKDEVLRWYGERVKTNMDNLLSWAGSKEIWFDDGIHSTFAHFSGNTGLSRSEPLDRSEFQSKCRLRHTLLWSFKIGDNHVTCPSLSEWRDGKWLCYLNGTRATYFTVFSPTNSAEIALLAGCAIEDMPVFLRHWSLVTPYTGNAILDRVDPMVWKAKNPWLEIDLRVKIALSKRGMAEVEKRATLPNLSNLVNPEASVVQQ